MKLFTVAFMAAFVAVALTQDPTSTTPESTTHPTTITTTKKATTTSTTTTTTPKPTAKPTTSSPPDTTPEPITTTTTAKTTTTENPKTTTPPQPEEATRGNFTVMSGDEVCAFVLVKVTVTQNATRFPFVKPELIEENSSCNEEEVNMWIQSINGDELQIVIKHDKTNFYISEISARIASGITADRANLTQFSTPSNQFYKCSAASEVELLENDVNVVFSEMMYQAFKKTKTAEFVGSQLECVTDYRSDTVIIAVGCALALLVVVILVAYLIARRRNRQRGYQSV